MKTIIVTGAGGYIGKHVINELVKSKKFKIIAISRNIEKFDTSVKVLNIDIFKNTNFNLVLNEKPNILLHLAWEKGFEHNSDSHIINLPKHYQFIKELIKGGIKHIAVIGSMHEVGYWEGSVDEKTPTNPLSLYGIAKNSLRQSLEILGSENNFLFQWLRCYYVYGDDKKNNSIFSKICNMESNNQKDFPLTDGKNKYDFIHIDELANQIVSCVSQDKITGTINCCSGKPVSLKNKIEDFLKEHNFKIKPIYGAYPTREYDSPAIWGDDSKIREIIKSSN